MNPIPFCLFLLLCMILMSKIFVFTFFCISFKFLLKKKKRKIKAIASDAILNWATGAISDIGSILGIQNYDNETIQGILEKFT